MKTTCSKTLIPLLAAALMLTLTGHAGALPVEGNGLRAWLDAGQGVILDGNGLVQQWSDMTGNGNHAVQDEHYSYRPIVTNSSLFNNLPALNHYAPEAAGATYFLYFTNPVPAKTMFYVYSFGDLTRRQDNIAGTADLAYHNIITPSQSYRVYWLYPAIVDYTTPDLNAHVYQYYVNSAAPFRQLRDDGDTMGSNTDPFTDGAITRIGWGNSGPGNQAFKGMNAEIIIYGNALNGAQRLITENYLSAKYAIPMALAASDKYAGDEASKGHFDFEVIGIGRASDGAHTLSTGGGLALAENPAAPLGVDDYVLAGHPSGVNSVVNSSLPSKIKERWSRVWYLDVTGTPGAKLTFDFSDGGLAGQPDPGKSYRLLYATTNSFDFVDLGLSPTTTGDQVSFAINSTPSDGYYTLAVAAGGTLITVK